MLEGEDEKEGTTTGFADRRRLFSSREPGGDRDEEMKRWGDQRMR
jgi:hypothetical protein